MEVSPYIVDGLNIQGNLEISDLYEDYIFGKYTAHSYNDNGVREKDLLERIHRVQLRCSQWGEYRTLC